MCRKQVEQQGGATSECHTSIIHCLSAEVDRSWQSFITAANYAPSACSSRPARRSCQRYCSSFLVLFLFLFAFVKQRNHPSCLSHRDMAAKFGQCFCSYLLCILNRWTWGQNQILSMCTELDWNWIMVIVWILFFPLCFKHEHVV